MEFKSFEDIAKYVRDLEKENTNLRRDNAALKLFNANKEKQSEELKTLKAQNAYLNQKVESLERKNHIDPDILLVIR